MRFVLIIALLILSDCIFASEESLKENDILSMQLSIFNDYHFSEKVLTNKELTNVFYRFFGEIDSKQTLFDAQSINLIISSSLREANNKGKIMYFFSAFFKEYKSKSIIRKSAVEKFNLNPQNYNTKEIFILPSDPNNILPKNKLAVEKRFNQYLKYSVLSEMISYAMLDSVDYKIPNDSILKFEKEVKADLVKSYKEWITQLEGDSSEIRLLMFEELLNSIATEFDPHSNYFSISEKQEFEQQLSKEVFLFGFSIGEEGDKTIITKISPGGAAWNSNELHEGDVILSIKVPRGKSINAEKKNFRIVRRFVKSVQSDEIFLTILTSDGARKKVKLKKQKVEIDENSVKSFVLKGDKKIGYITLPAFYTNYVEGSQLGCANDVARELIKLKRDSIDGLIVDLRYNGGGSMKEAVGLAGIFIDAGPVLIQKYRDEKPTTIKDFNRGLSYDGPMAIMVNKYSASASEIVSAALQDYNRAIIVGSPTYGKATAQNIIPLDTNFMIGRTNKMNDLGFVKLTIAKMYRIKGNTHQLTGVVPDVILPNLTDGIEAGESQNKTALKSDSIFKKIYHKPLPLNNTSMLATMSNQRVAKDYNFQEIKKMNLKLQSLVLEIENRMPLGLNEYKSLFEKKWNVIKKISELSKDTTNVYQIINNNYDNEVISLYEQVAADNKELKTKLQHDIYIEETYKIINDLITK